MCIREFVYEVHTPNGVVEVEGDFYSVDEHGFLHVYTSNPSTSTRQASFSDWNFIAAVN